MRLQFVPLLTALSAGSMLLAAPATAQDQRPEAPPVPNRAPANGQGTNEHVPSDSVQTVYDIVYTQALNDPGDRPMKLTFDAAFPKQSDGKPLPAIVYIHGGGWRNGSKEVGRPFTAALARGGYFAVTIQYRLADDAKYPAAVEDCRDLIRFLRSHAEELGIDAKRIGVWGHSAGGHLSALLGTSGNSAAMQQQVADGAMTAKVNCVVSLSGPADLTGGFGDEGQGIIGYWIGAEQFAERAKEASPITYVDGDDPPILLIHGSEDRLVPPVQAQRFAAALEKAGIEHELLIVEGEGHNITSRSAYRAAAAFFDKHLGGHAVSANESPASESGEKEE